MVTADWENIEQLKIRGAEINRQSSMSTITLHKYNGPVTYYYDPVGFQIWRIKKCGPAPSNLVPFFPDPLKPCSILSGPPPPIIILSHTLIAIFSRKPPYSNPEIYRRFWLILYFCRNYLLMIENTFSNHRCIQSKKGKDKENIKTCKTLKKM